MVCNRCNERDAVGAQRWCSQCKREYDQAYYQKPENKKRHRARTKENQRKFVEWYHSLKDGPCVDCQMKFHPVAMQWDHRPDLEKIGDLGTLKLRGNKQLILDEIKKCELVCSNCHSIRTYQRAALASAHGLW